MTNAQFLVHAGALGATIGHIVDESINVVESAGQPTPVGFLGLATEEPTHLRRGGLRYLAFREDAWVISVVIEVGSVFAKSAHRAIARRFKVLRADRRSDPAAGVASVA